jgi:hypothetical protein
MIESITYAALAERLSCSAEAARALAKRKRWRRELGNDGKARVMADLAEINRTPAADRTPALLAKIEALQAELVAWQATAAGHRSDCERERDRCDRLASELGEIATRMARPWWRRLAG